MKSIACSQRYLIKIYQIKTSPHPDNPRREIIYKIPEIS